MGEKLTFRYDSVGDILFIDKTPPYDEQQTDEIEYGVFARLNPDTEEIENLEILWFSKRLTEGSVFELPVAATLRAVPDVA